jgi:hypothetical protein
VCFSRGEACALDVVCKLKTDHERRLAVRKQLNFKPIWGNVKMITVLQAIRCCRVVQENVTTVFADN